MSVTLGVNTGVLRCLVIWGVVHVFGRVRP